MTTTSHRRLLLGVGLALSLSACAPALRLHEPTLAVPDQYAVAAPPPDAAANAATAETSWSALLTDPALVSLIETALANNQELRILEQEIQIADAEWLARRGEVWPRLGIGAGAEVEKVGRYTSQGASDAANEITPGREFPEPLGGLEVGFRASWEVDVWKKLRNEREAARQRYLASVEGRNFMVTRLVAEVAHSYYELMALDNQLEAVQANIGLMQEGLVVVRLQKDAARVTELAVQRFEAALLRSQGQQLEIQQQIVEAESRVNVLCGRYPQPVARSSAGFVDRAPVVVRADAPAALLERRPDVRAAEHELEAARLDVRAARAMFYPALGVDAALGLEAFELAYLTAAPESLLYSLSADLLGPLLNRKALRGNHSAASARQVQAVVAYERTILVAYTEVTNELSRVANLGRTVDLRAQQVARLQQAVETSGGLFQAARADYLEVLTTRREALESQMELIETRQQQLSAGVNVYQSLGGGWQPTPTPTPTTAPDGR